MVSLLPQYRNVGRYFLESTDTNVDLYIDCCIFAQGVISGAFCYRWHDILADYIGRSVCDLRRSTVGNMGKKL